MRNHRGTTCRANSAGYRLGRIFRRRRAFKHAKLSAVRLAGDINAKVTDKASLDELVAKIKEQLTKLGPILDLEIVQEPQGTDGGRAIEHGRRRGA